MDKSMARLMSAITRNPDLGGVNLVRAAIAKASVEAGDDVGTYIESRWSDAATARTIKAAVAVNTLSDWAPEGMSNAGAEFFGAVLQRGALGAILVRAHQVAFGQRIVATTSPVTASWRGEKEKNGR